MAPPNSLFAVVLLLSGAVCLVVALALWLQSRNALGAKPLVIWLLGLAWWDITYAIFWAGLPGPVPYFWLDITLVGAYIIPTAALIFTLEFSQTYIKLRWPLLLALIIIPVCVFILQWTDSWHNLYFGGHRAENTTSIFVAGPVYWFNVYYSYALILITLVILGITFVRSSGIYRRQTALILAAMLIPWIVHIVAVTGLGVSLQFDITPFIFTFTAVMIAYGLIRYHLLDIVPIAHSLVLQSMTDGVLIMDLRNRVVEINPATERWLGRSSQSVYGHSIEAVLSHWPNIFKKFPLDQLKQVHDDVLIDEQNQVYMDTQITPILDQRQQKVGWLVIGRNVSQLKATQKAIAEALEFNRTIVDASPIGMLIYKASGPCVSANTAATTITGNSLESLMAQNFHTIASWKASELYETALQALNTGQTIDKQIHTVTSSGREVWLNATLTRFTTAGEPHLLLMFADDSERQRAENALRTAHVELQAAHDELEQRVLERTAELQTANLALEKALQARDAFMAAISHELRTPLTAILSLTEILQIQHYGSLNDRQMRAIANIELSGNRLLEVVNDVLAYTQLQTGTYPIRPAHFPLNRICQVSLQDVHGQAEARQQQIKYTIFPEDIVLMIDETSLKRILANLLGNAIKFTPKEGAIALTVTGLADENQVRISVSDTGIGIKTEDFPRLFQPFVQIDDRLARQYEGTGLGLALVKGLTELCGGRVEFESSAGQGSCFSIILPWDGRLRSKNPAD